MNKGNKITLGMLAGFAFSVFTVAASTAGTLAWYAYSRTNRITFTGTSVAKSSLLSVGIVDDARLLSDQKVAEYELSRETHDGHSIVFTHKVDGIDYHVIQDYLFASSYATNILLPLTTNARSVDSTGDLTLFESPTSGETSLNTDADTAHYVQLPLAFRMQDEDGNNIPDIDIWLTRADTQASGENIDNSLRVFVENSQRKFLMKPADKGTTTGRTYVGGPLDLDGDGTYDYSMSTRRELYYGQCSGDFVYPPSPYGTPKDIADYDNVNNVTDLRESTFYSKHHEEAYVPDYSLIHPAYVEHVPFGKVKPSTDENGNYIEGTTGIKMTTTNSNDNVGYVTFTIYIEGWDHVVVDRASNYSFNLSLEFKVNK